MHSFISTQVNPSSESVEPAGHDGVTLGVDGVVVAVQSVPFPMNPESHSQVKPDLHLHVKPPSVLVQVASS